MSSSLYRLTKGRQVDRTTQLTTGASHKIVRRTGGGADFSASYEEDGEVNSTLVINDQVKTDQAASISIEGNHSYGTYNEEMEDVLFSTYGSAISQISLADCQLFATGNLITSLTTDAFNNLTVGEIVKMSAGPTQFSEVTYALVTAIVTGASPSVALSTDWVVLTDEGTNDVSMTFDGGAFITEGTTQHYSTFEEFFQTGVYQSWIGAVATGMSYTRTNKSKSTVSFNYSLPTGIDTNGDPSATTILSGSPTAASTTRAMTHKHVNVMRLNGATLSLATVGHSYSLSRALGESDTHGVYGAEDFFPDALVATGSISIRNSASVHPYITAMQDDTVVSIGWQEVDSAGNVLWTFFPEVVITSATRNPGGRANGVVIELPWSAKYSTTEGYTMIQCLFPAA